MPMTQLSAKVGFTRFGLPFTAKRKPKLAQPAGSKLGAQHMKEICPTSFFHNMLAVNSVLYGAA